MVGGISVACTAHYRQGVGEFTALLRRRFLTKEQLERAKRLSDKIGTPIDIYDVNPQKNKYSYMGHFAIALRRERVEDAGQEMAQPSLFGG